jgi:hypothetical protein
MDEVGGAVDGVENPKPFCCIDVRLVPGFFGKQLNVGRDLSQVVGYIILNGEIDIGDQVTVTFVLHRTWMRRPERFRTDLRCLPSYFE